MSKPGQWKGESCSECKHIPRVQQTGMPCIRWLQSLILEGITYGHIKFTFSLSWQHLRSWHSQYLFWLLSTWSHLFKACRLECHVGKHAETVTRNSSAKSTVCTQWGEFAFKISIRSVQTSNKLYSHATKL